MLERLAHLGADVQPQVHRQEPPLGLEPGLDPAEVEPFDELDHQEVLAVVAQADVEDLHDVAVAQHRQHLGLGDQQLDEALVLAQVREDPLDRDGLLESSGGERATAEDLGHAAYPDAIE